METSGTSMAQARSAFSCCTFSLQQRALQDRRLICFCALCSLFTVHETVCGAPHREPTLQRGSCQRTLSRGPGIGPKRSFLRPGLPTNEVNCLFGVSWSEDPQPCVSCLLHTSFGFVLSNPNGRCWGHGCCRVSGPRGRLCHTSQRLVLGDAINAAQGQQNQVRMRSQTYA